MAEYVKREDVLKILSEKNAPWNGYVKCKELPAEDVQPKKEGKWLTEVLDGVPGMRPLVFVCSRCWHISNVETRYCCNCGARMG